MKNGLITLFFLILSSPFLYGQGGKGAFNPIYVNVEDVIKSETDTLIDKTYTYSNSIYMLYYADTINLSSTKKKVRLDSLVLRFDTLKPHYGFKWVYNYRKFERYGTFPEPNSGYRGYFETPPFPKDGEAHFYYGAERLDALAKWKNDNVMYVTGYGYDSFFFSKHYLIAHWDGGGALKPIYSTKEVWETGPFNPFYDMSESYWQENNRYRDPRNKKYFYYKNGKIVGYLSNIKTVFKGLSDSSFKAIEKYGITDFCNKYPDQAYISSQLSRGFRVTKNKNLTLGGKPIRQFLKLENVPAPIYIAFRIAPYMYEFYKVID